MDTAKFEIVAAIKNCNGDSFEKRFRATRKYVSDSAQSLRLAGVAAALERAYMMTEYSQVDIDVWTAGYGEILGHVLYRGKDFEITIR